MERLLVFPFFSLFSPVFPNLKAWKTYREKQSHIRHLGWPALRIPFVLLPPKRYQRMWNESGKKDEICWVLKLLGSQTALTLSQVWGFLRSSFDFSGDSQFLLRLKKILSSFCNVAVKPLYKLRELTCYFQTPAFPHWESYHTSIDITGSDWRCFPTRQNSGRSPRVTLGIQPAGLQWLGPFTPIWSLAIYLSRCPFYYIFILKMGITSIYFLKVWLANKRVPSALPCRLYSL